jgi:integration host factor subunit beta
MSATANDLAALPGRFLTMTRSDLTATLAQRFPVLTRADVTECADLLIDTMAEAITAGRRIEIRDFGNFTLHFREPRIARNPKTGAKVNVPGKWAPHFRPGKGLYEAVDPARTVVQRPAREAVRSPRISHARELQMDGKATAR